jgi:hypothetical protein
MKAKLVGAGFKITPEGISEAQSVTEDKSANWDWKVTPEQPGKGVLYLHLYKVHPEGHEQEKVHEQPITVTVPPADKASAFINDWLEPLGISVTAIAAGAGAAWAWWRRIRSKRKTSRPAPWA